MIYGNKEIVRTFTRNNPPAGYVGGSVDYRVPANVYFGDTQEEADSKAEDDIKANGQDYANTYADIIPAVWYNDQVCDEFIKNNCVSGRGSKEQVCIEEGRFVSYVSKKDANDKARVELGRIGQGEANSVGACCEDWASQPLRGLFYKNDCEAGASGKEGIVYELPAGAVISDISQIDADTLAYRKFMKEGQEKANSEGSCSPVFYNTTIGDWFEKVCPFGYKSGKVYYSIKANRFRSWISVEDANAKAREVLMVEGQEHADLNLECEKWIENIDQEDQCYW